MLYIEDFKSAYRFSRGIVVNCKLIDTLRRKKDEGDPNAINCINDKIQTLEYENAIMNGTLYEVEKFIGECKDPVIRQILYLRYIEGKGWDAVSFIVSSGCVSKEATRKMAERYLAKMGIGKREGEPQ